MTQQQQQIRDEIIAMRNAMRDLDAGTLEVIDLEDVYVIAPTLIGVITEVFKDMVAENVWRCLPDTEWISQKLLDNVDWEQAAQPDVDPVLVVDHMAETWHLNPHRIWHDEWWNGYADDDR